MVADARKPGASTVSTSSSTNRRCHVRSAVVQPALLRAPGLDDAACEIRNFSLGGLFLQVNDEGSFAILKHKLPQTLEVSFTSSTSSGERRFTVKGRAAHASGNGIGIAFERSPVEALKVLREVAGIDRMTTDPVTYFGALEQDPGDLKQACADALAQSLSSVLEKFFQAIPEVLADAANRTQSDAELAAYKDAIAELQQAREIITRDFIERALEQAGHGAASADLYPGRPDKGALSLLDNEEFEDWLNLRDEIAKTEGLFEAELRTLDQRLGALVRASIDHTNNPFGPNALSHCFRGMIKDRIANNDIRLALYRRFEQSLAASLGPLYQRLQDLLPAVAPVPSPARSIESPPAAGTTHSSTEPAERPRSPAESHSRATTGSPPATRSGIVRTIGTLRMLSSGKHRSSATADVAARPAAAEAGAEQSALYDEGQLLAALRALQQRGETEGYRAISGQQLETELTAILNLEGEGTRKIKESDRERLQAVGDFLDVALTDIGLGPALQTYIQRLQPALLGLALKEPAFLDDASHPARRVLDLLGQLASAGEGTGEFTQILSRLDEPINRIVQEASDNPDIFDRARADLEAIAVPLQHAQALQLERVRDACEARQQIEQARQLVESEVNRRIAGKKTPKIVVSLLDAGWRQFLVTARIRHETDNPDWLQGLAVIDKLLLWLAEETANEEPARAEVIELINFVDLQLMSVTPDKALQDHMIGELTALLVGVGQPKVKRNPEYVLAPASAADKPDAVDQALDHVSVRLVEQLRVGDWLALRLPPEEQTPLRLAWIGETPPLYVFVDRTGARRLEVSKRELADRLAAGMAERIDNLDLPLMDRTTDRMMQEMHKKLIQAATRDPVTGLINRKEFVRLLRLEYVTVDQAPLQHVLCLVEIDQFRIINTGSGLEAGDTLLKGISLLIRKSIKDTDLLARLGDDAFGILLKSYSGDEGFHAAERLRSLINGYHFFWEDKSYSLGVNIGLAAFTEHTSNLAALLKNADTACMAAKAKGRNHIQLYRETDSELRAQQSLMDWAGRIDKMLDENHLFLRCQLIAPVPWNGTDPPHYEILLGVTNDDGSSSLPGPFLAAVERCKRMPEIDSWVMRSTFDWIMQNGQRFAAIEGFSINLSGQSVASQEILDFVHAELRNSSLPAEKITFEITETSAIGNLGQAEKFIRQIKRYGCKFSLDDFGSGFASYSYLKNLNVDFLKIDGSFVKDLATSDTDYLMVKSMNEIGHSLGLKTIAEYVENDAIVAKLSEIGVDYAQGYGIRRPGSLKDI
jgi:diguanylate cyclase (GGDEF)-like protein